ncbi:hypothetical protein [Fodinicurvata fenggangensis]|uniref:hypothetical protein n=1 Tax=Fodinicurvata fenggangensis TaxID=1121830 RepID=UPI0004791690|nr:hypothetical protein [Fodinicurvata fenggangensis]
MTKTMIPAIGFALTTALALPAMAQTTPSNEGYAGGHVQAQTAFGTADVVPSFDANGTQLSGNPGIEGYSGERTLNANAALGTLTVESAQYASNPEVTSDVIEARQTRNDFAEMAQRVRYSGR